VALQVLYCLIAMDNLGDISPARSLFDDLEDRINHPRIPPLHYLRQTIWEHRLDECPYIGIQTGIHCPSISSTNVLRPATIGSATRAAWAGRS